ncbi:SCO family protein [Rhabdothermincola salaria]|uniref:SCO family protein n=1 Tax=Rhabdothermincola salaria TaxID=2903142 RepID=UPI001E373AF4|nr:SCO family protein [Rhabdothermincola salaria]MCD9622611.1 SCO family protein [Rhabdothermincola salaria]
MFPNRPDPVVDLVAVGDTLAMSSRAHRVAVLAVGVGAAIALLAAGCGSSSDDGASAPGPTVGASDLVGDAPDPAVEVGDLVLTDHATEPAGEPFAVAAPEGQLLVVYFGYLSCPDVCPLTMADTAAGLAELSPDERERVEVAFVTVDLARDDGPRIADYLSHFFPDSGTHALRAADDGALYKVTYRFNVQWEIEPHEPGDFYAVAHTGDTYVVDDQGRLVWRWPYGTAGPEIGAGLRSLLASTYPST